MHIRCKWWLLELWQFLTLKLFRYLINIPWWFGCWYIVNPLSFDSFQENGCIEVRYVPLFNNGGSETFASLWHSCISLIFPCFPWRESPRPPKNISLKRTARPWKSLVGVDDISLLWLDLIFRGELVFFKKANCTWWHLCQCDSAVGGLLTGHKEFRMNRSWVHPWHNKSLRVKLLDHFLPRVSRKSSLTIINGIWYTPKVNRLFFFVGGIIFSIKGWQLWRRMRCLSWKNSCFWGVEDVAGCFHCFYNVFEWLFKWFLMIL